MPTRGEPLFTEAPRPHRWQGGWRSRDFTHRHAPPVRVRGGCAAVHRHSDWCAPPWPRCPDRPPHPRPAHSSQSRSRESSPSFSSFCFAADGYASATSESTTTQVASRLAIQVWSPPPPSPPALGFYVQVEETDASGMSLVPQTFLVPPQTFLPISQTEYNFTLGARHAF
jgi:hypothetical protein